jgi:glutamine cyclotransferase
MKILTCFTIALMMIGFTFLTGCVKNDAQPIISQPGHYEDPNIGFTFTYDPTIFTMTAELVEGDVLRVTGAQGQPDMKVMVIDIPEDEKYSPDTWPEAIKEGMQADFPDATRFKFISNKTIKLETGQDANSSVLQWRWQGKLVLYTAIVNTEKNGKLITAICTSIPNMPPVNQLTYLASQIKLTP